MSNYVSIKQTAGEENRISTLDIRKDDGIFVIGILPHGYGFEPKTTKDAKALIKYLQSWIRKKGV